MVPGGSREADMATPTKLVWLLCRMDMATPIPEGRAVHSPYRSDIGLHHHISSSALNKVED